MSFLKAFTDRVRQGLRRTRDLLDDGLDATGVVAALPLPDWAPPDRPYLVVNMVATVDGRATIHGHAGPIGNEADRQYLQHLRTRGDAILVGAGTARSERFRPFTVWRANFFASSTMAGLRSP